MSLTQAQKTPIKHAAEKLGLKTLDAYNGFHMAHIDSIEIGDIIYKDPIAFVFDPLTQEKTLEQRDGVIGIDFIRRMGEICIDARAKELIFPISNIKTIQHIHNIRLENGRKLFIESNDKSGNLKLLLSTGEMETYSLQPYYEKHSDKFADENMILQNKGSNVQNIDDVLRVPDIKLCSAGHYVTLSNARIEKNENQVGMDGVLGMDFINRFNRVILYFNNMSISMD